MQRLNAKENRQSGCPEYSNRFGAAMVELMPELEAAGMWNGKPISFADDDGIYRFDVGGDG